MSNAHILFEEENAFKAGTVLADTLSALQVELPSGKRVKVKTTHVLLHFREPSCTALLAQADQESTRLETAFLWEVCTDNEFSFIELARDYYGHDPLPVEATAILLSLQAAPLYFHRKGKGRFRKAPPDILKAAIAGQEKKHQQALTIEHIVNDLKAGQLPAAFSGILNQLLYKPDRNRLETKALELACEATRLSSAQLLLRCGAIASTHDYHFHQFLFEHFPQGTEFECFDDSSMPVEQSDLPEAKVQAFSIDDASTTEIDDAFSLTPQANGWRIGIHIAAPGLGITPESPLGAIAQSRLSTVYLPGRKITMLPDEIINRFTLIAGRVCPAVSLYLDVGSDFKLLSTETRLERVPIIANLRHHDIEPVFNEITLQDGGPDFPFKAELTTLWELATVLEAGRGKASANPQGLDYNFDIDWNEPEGRVDISQRQRGAPLDKLVAELMIFANTTWGKLLADADIAAVYRAQSSGKTRMTTAALPHEGLGVDQYAWSSSPLRRYVDLVNQWQLIAHLRQQTPYFTASSEPLLESIRDFELTYTAYNEFQRRMERYWCFRWLLQNGMETSTAQVVRESLVRLACIPLFLRTPSLPAISQNSQGSQVTVAISQIDLLTLEAHCQYKGVLSQEN